MGSARIRLMRLDLATGLKAGDRRFLRVGLELATARVRNLLHRDSYCLISGRSRLWQSEAQPMRRRYGTSQAPHLVPHVRHEQAPGREPPYAERGDDDGPLGNDHRTCPDLLRAWEFCMHFASSASAVDVLFMKCLTIGQFSSVENLGDLIATGTTAFVLVTKQNLIFGDLRLTHRKTGKTTDIALLRHLDTLFVEPRGVALNPLPMMPVHPLQAGVAEFLVLQNLQHSST